MEHLAARQHENTPPRVESPAQRWWPASGPGLEPSSFCLGIFAATLEKQLHSFSCHLPQRTLPVLVPTVMYRCLCLDAFATEHGENLDGKPFRTLKTTINGWL